MTQQYALPEWPLAECWVVSYLLDGHTHATRHRGGCKMLQLARNTLEQDLPPDRTFGRRVQNLRVLEQPRYQAQVDAGNMPPWTDHICARGALATASFRSAGGAA